MANNINFKKSSPSQVVQMEDQHRDPMKLDIKYRRYINTALIIGPMTMLMALVGVMRNYGLHQGWVLKSIVTWLTMFPIAYVCAFFIIPVANKLTGKIKFTDASEKNE
jgi:hypothetical protein